MRRLVSFAAVCGVALSAGAQEAPAGAEAGRLGGVYARASLVATWMQHLESRESSGMEATDFAYGGPGTGFSLAAGHAVASDLYLFAELRYDTALAPREISGAVTRFDGLSLSYLTVGPGAAWYFGDWWLSGMVGFARTHVSADQAPDTESLTGFGVRVGAGHQWSLAEGIGLGVGADIFWGSVSNTIQPAVGPAQEFGGTPLAFGLNVSALYN